MKTNYQDTLGQSEEQNSSEELRNENGKALEIESRPLRNWNNILNRRSWFVVDMRNSKIVNGPFESSKIATRYVEQHKSLYSQCVMNGVELLKKHQTDLGLPQNKIFK